MPLFLGACAFLGGLTAVGLCARGLLPAFAEGPTGERPGGTDLSKLSDRFEHVARVTAPSVIAVKAVKTVLRGGKARTTDDSGSGAVVRIPSHRGLFVLTNNHVINQAAPKEITISLADQRIVRPARVWADPESDIALLGLGEDVVGLTPIPLGDSDKARVGQWVLAIGSPFGLDQTVTHGIISARGRGQVSLGSTIRIKDFLQTDAAINPGSSGGPLLNLNGEIIGINTAIASPDGGGNRGVAFSIPINLVKTIARQLLEKGRVTRGFLGVQLSPGLEATDALRLGLTRAQGALVEGAHPDTPAAAAGLRRNDVILAIDEVPIRNENHFINAVSVLPPGQRIKVRVWRNRAEVTLSAVVGDWGKAEGRFKR
jgi:S1-C subfamily serine protease